MKIIEEHFYVAQIKIPFNIEKKSTQISVVVLVKFWHFAWEKGKTICKIKILLWKKILTKRNLENARTSIWNRNAIEYGMVGKDVVIFMGRFNSFNEVMKSLF